MADWLFKEEPESYSFDQLTQDGSTLWTGVTNALALKYLRLTQPGDRAFFYATGKIKAIVGEMTIVANDSAGVTVRPLRAFRKPVSLAAIKADPTLSTWELVRLPRLSVMPVTAQQWTRIHELEASLS